MVHRLLPLLAAALLVGGCDSSEEPPAKADPARTKAALRGAPAPLAALHVQSNRLLDGGVAAYRKRLRELRGHPVVVNKWASWCGPCRAEFPHFQRQSVKLGKRIAFLGVDSNDDSGGARKFLDRYPVSFPSYVDRDSRIAAEFNAVQAFPSTAFYDRRGKLAYLKQGYYPSERKLVEDIQRYAR